MISLTGLLFFSLYHFVVFVFRLCWTKSNILTEEYTNHIEEMKKKKEVQQDLLKQGMQHSHAGCNLKFSKIFNNYVHY